MRYRRLGSSGLSVSEISLVNYLPQSEPLDLELMREWARRGVDLGITTFDTATIYSSGRAESALAFALNGVDRASIELTTKVFHPTGAGANQRGLGRKHLMVSVERSLRELATDYIDVYQAHRFDDTVPLEETMCAFADMVRAGKVLYLGISEWSAQQIRAAVPLADELHIPIVSNRPQYSLLWRVIEAEVVPVCTAAGIGQIVWSTDGLGLLGEGLRPDGRTPAGITMTDELAVAADRARHTVVQSGLTMTQFSIAWALGQPGVSSVVCTPRSVADVEKYASCSEVDLDADLIDAIETIFAPFAVFDPTLSGLKTAP